MARKFYFWSSNARRGYSCGNCDSQIQKNDLYFRDDPGPWYRERYGLKSRPICYDCVAGWVSGVITIDTGVPQKTKAFSKISRSVKTDHQLILFDSDETGEKFGIPTSVQLINVTKSLADSLAINWNAIYEISDEDFEILICDRLSAMGFHAQRVGSANRKDGGIDIYFWNDGPVPFLGAAQVKHHRSAFRKTGPSAVRELRGVVSSNAFDVGIVVTNTTFTPDAQFAALYQNQLIRLRDGEDVRQWIAGNFTEGTYWRPLPKKIQLCPGVEIEVPDFS